MCVSEKRVGICLWQYCWVLLLLLLRLRLNARVVDGVRHLSQYTVVFFE
jgi:hypothetical protein